MTDISILYEHNFDSLRHFFAALWFFDGTSYLNEYIQCAETWDRRNEEASIILMNLIKQSDCINIKYETMFISPWACHSEIEDEHKKLYYGIFDWICGARKYSEKQDKCLIILMTLILLHSTDGISSKNLLSDIDKVEKIQQKYVNLLHKYLKSHLTPDNAFNQLHNGLMLVSATSRINDLFQKRLQLEF